MSTAYGVGNHAIVLGTHSTLTTALKWAWIAQIVLLLAIGLGKAAVVNFLLSVQGPTFPKKRWFLIFLAATNVCPPEPISILSSINAYILSLS